MRRIYFLFLVRNCAPFAFDCVMFCLVVFAATFFVSVKDVFANLSVATAGGGLSVFSESAFTETELSTKFLLLALGLVGFLAARHLRQAVSAARLVRDGNKQPPSL